MFSSRVPEIWRPNRMTQAFERLVAKGTRVVDLTESNPTRVGLKYPTDLLNNFCGEASLVYDPQPRGLSDARLAVAAHLGLQGLTVDADRVLLATGTSEAYSLLFKLLCDPGDTVLIPEPSYPLLEYLARLDGIEPVSYPLVYDGAWEIDGEALWKCVSDRTRALVIVNPNNPTGSFLSEAGYKLISEVCRKYGLALISDEVFGQYSFDTMAEPVRSVLGKTSDVLTFGLGGFSKSIGLPQLKLSWIIVDGDHGDVSVALRKLEFIADSYLSVSTPVQWAARGLLEKGSLVANQIKERVRINHTRLKNLVGTYPALDLLRSDGGWYAVLQVPAVSTEEALVLKLLEKEHLRVHPGYMFDFPREAFLVLSLLLEPSDFEDGVIRLLSRAADIET